MARSGRKACRMSGSGRKAIPNVWEWSGDPPGCPGMVGGPPSCPGMVRGPPGCPGVVERLSRMSRSGRRPSQLPGSGLEILSDVREWSGGPPR